MSGAELTRTRDLQAGVQLETFTVLWMVVEALVSIGAGIIAGSLLLIAFGLDSGVELISGGVLLWRLIAETRDGDEERVERAERRAAWVVFLCLAALCVYVLATAAYGLLTQAKPDASPVGIAVCALAVAIMPLLALGKRRLAQRLNSGALRGDAASAITCAYMAATVLVGLVLNAVFHWWWAEHVASLAFLVWLVGETREALEEARGEEEETRPPKQGTSVGTVDAD